MQKFTPFSFRKNVLKNIPHDAKGCMHSYLLQFDLITKCNLKMLAKCKFLNCESVDI